MNRKPEDIVKLVEGHERQTTQLRARMDDDYSLSRLDEYLGEEELDGFRKFTSNEPKTFLNKAVALLSSAKRVVRVPMDDAVRQEREGRNEKERFCIGVLNAADERLERFLLQSLQDTATVHSCLRGWVAARAVIVKDDEDTAHIDVIPWDVRNTYWALGDNGLAWACLVTYRSRDEIKAVYNKDVDPQDSSEEKGFKVYDFWDTEHNVVTTGDTVLKPAEEHKVPDKRVPVVIVPVGPAPPFDAETLDDSVKDYGESIYQADRAIYDEWNFAMSIFSEFVKRSLKQPVVITSPDGSKTLAENPYLSGTEISLPIGTTIETLDLMTVAQEAGVFVGLMTGEIQRGSLPHSAFGELQFQLSGFAINSLRKGMATVITPPKIAVEKLIKQTCMLLADQYATGGFGSMELSGHAQTPRRDYFKDSIEPQMVKEGGDVEVELLPELPQDDVAAVAMAQQLRDGAVPVVDDRTIREEVLGFQDADLIGDEVMAQTANRAGPLATAVALGTAAARRGEMQIAKAWVVEANKQVLLMQLQLAQLSAVASGIAPTGTNGANDPTLAGGNSGGGGFAPTVAPGPVQGVPPPTPVPQQGPFVPPGTPRPGAVSPDDVRGRLAQLGLFGG